MDIGSGVDHLPGVAVRWHEMKLEFDRRGFLRTAGLVAVGRTTYGQSKVVRTPGTHVRIGLNAYSFNRPLAAGTMTLENVVDYCAEHGIEALDATGYYFKGYPAVPSDEAIYRLKRRAFVNGVALCGTGVRNDFATSDAAKRKTDIQMVKDWVEVTAKLGAPIMRVFTGPRLAEGFTFDQTLDWMVPAFQECAAHAGKYGVVLGLQNHNDFAKTAGESMRILKAVDSPWFGLILDIGSLRQSDVYEEVEKLLPYAVSWQLKESVWYGTKEVPTDLKKVKAIIERGGYRGYLPIETLGTGDPAEKIAKFLAEVRTVFGG